MMIVKSISPEETKPLRHKVLWPHIPLQENCVIDIDHREDAIHLGTYLDEKLIAIGSFFSMSSPKIKFQNQYRLRAMASDPEFRGRHAAQLLVIHGIEILRSQDIEVLWCDARLTAVPFYAAIGFQKIEDIYEVPLIGPHQFMWIEL